MLDADVYTVDPAKTAVTPTDVLLYCYYGGLLEIGRWAGERGAPPNVAACCGTCFRPCFRPWQRRPGSATRSHLAQPRPALPAAAPACRRRYAHALELLLTALTAPTMVPNAITAACAKKYVQVSDASIKLHFSALEVFRSLNSG